MVGCTNHSPSDVQRHLALDTGASLLVAQLGSRIFVYRWFWLALFFAGGKGEAMMQTQFGDQYTAYKQKTKRLIPFIL